MFLISFNERKTILIYLALLRWFLGLAEAGNLVINSGSSPGFFFVSPKSFFFRATSDLDRFFVFATWRKKMRLTDFND